MIYKNRLTKIRCPACEVPCHVSVGKLHIEVELTSSGFAYIPTGKDTLEQVQEIIGDTLAACTFCKHEAPISKFLPEVKP